MSEDFISFLERISKTELEDGQTIIEKTTYQDVALWWFIRSTLFHRIENITKLEKFPKRKIFCSIQLLFDFLTSILVRANTFFYKQNKKKKSFNKKILITAFNMDWRKILDTSTMKLKKSDAFFDSIFTELLKRNYEIITTCQYSIRGVFFGLKIIIEKRKKQKGIIHKPLNNYWSYQAWKKSRLAKKYFKKIWEELENDDTFKNLWKYNNRNLYELIKDDLAYYFTQSFPQIIKYTETVKRLLSKEKPDLILLQDEYGGFGKSLIVTGKLRNIPTLAIQHGIIHPFHYGYIHAKNEISQTGSIKSPYCPIPDKIAVYGSYFKRFLTQKTSYPKDSIVITGQPRYDILTKPDKIFSKKKVFKRLRINPDKKLIVWTTQSHGLSKEENKKLFYAVYKTTKKLSDKIQLVVKLHPREKKVHMHRDIAKKVGINPIIIKNINIYELLYACDAMITRHSTTATEAVILNKPVIILNLSGQPDPVAYYTKSNVALGVYQEEKLLFAIESVLYDEEIKNKLTANRKKFISEHCYKIDGKATERIVKLIKKME